MIKLNLQYFGGRGSSGGKGGSADKGISTMSTNKSFEQVQEETEQLRSFPAGTKISYTEVTGEVNTYVAHDEARIGRNGRYLHRRVYSQMQPDKYTGVRAVSTKDPYTIAQGQWKK